jgi:hypothetical protein
VRPGRKECQRLLTRFDTWETKVCPHQEFSAPTELLDLPDERRLVRGVLNATRGRLYSCQPRQG